MRTLRRRALVTVVAALAWLGAAAGLGWATVDSGVPVASVSVVGVAPTVPSLTVVNREVGDGASFLVLVVLAGVAALGAGNLGSGVHPDRAVVRRPERAPAAHLRGPPQLRFA